MEYFDKSKKHYIQTDASWKDLGVILLLNGQNCRLCLLWSYLHSEWQYSYMMNFALDRLHNYVYGYIVTVEMDHKLLVSIWNKIII